MRFRLGGVSIRISFFFCLLLSLLILFDNGTIFAAFWMVCAHESAHLFAMKLCGVPLKEVSLEPFGILINNEELSLGFARRLCIIIAGSFANFLLAGGCFLIGFLANNPLLLKLFFINLGIAVINLLPITGLDGGQAFLEIISRLKKDKDAVAIGKTVSATLCVILLVIGIIICVKVRLNPSLCLLSFFLLVQTFTGGLNKN